MLLVDGGCRERYRTRDGHSVMDALLEINNRSWFSVDGVVGIRTIAKRQTRVPIHPLSPNPPLSPIPPLETE